MIEGIIAFLLGWGLVSLRVGFGPIDTAITGLQHLQAFVRWALREALPAVWRVRNRYWECLEAIRRP